MKMCGEILNNLADNALLFFTYLSSSLTLYQHHSP